MGAERRMEPLPRSQPQSEPSGDKRLLGPSPSRGGRTPEMTAKKPSFADGKGPGASSASPASPAPGWSALNAKEGGKRAKPEAPKFLLLLYEILEVEDARVIRWSEDGLALQILSPETVTEKILPKYFNHTNFHSFQRQLNYFGFRKWTKSKTDICTFSHPYFRQNQPELLQLIKRKKAPRRTPTPEQPGATGGPGQDRAGAKRSPSGKRKLSSEDRDERASGAPSHLPQNASSALIHPAGNGVAMGSLSTPHASARQAFAFSQDAIAQYLPGAPPLLNNVISPLAATECRKKAKKMDRKDYLESDRPSLPSMAALKSEPATSGSDAAGADLLSQVKPFSNGSLPTLDIVRSRIIRRQQAGGAPELVATSNGQQEFAPARPSSGMGVAPGPIRPDFPTASLKVSAALAAGDQSSAPSPSLNDPVNMLLRFKQSRTPTPERQGPAAADEKAADPNDSLTSLHNFLLGHSVYTNRLEAQLKYVVEENDSLKQLLDVRHREIESLKNDRSVLQHENASLVETKNKLFDINRDLMGKLFPQ